ncbi:acetylcholine receptor subunit alpha-like isoform X4 [Bactrocera dorsalis]|uniref:Acetylcholine receptor subunit alpha-like isoform X4 n=1 Tax=Bactrocera dorsalis TaxID=27457 RepID=A0ABM3J9U7_BACDO|nr:acetylcholine receptor subunit alpha-like isoform X4 [Bactrocera dorsalis]
MRFLGGEQVKVWLLSILMVHSAVAGNPDAKRLYDDLLSNYNKLVRPVVNTTDVLKVCIKLKLSQLIDVNLKNQIMTTNLWVEQSWYDYKLRWEPKEYGGVHMLHVPSDHIWRPDIVLYNKNEKFYTCCDEPYLDITFNITMRRKTLFYTVNIIIPCMGISFLTVLTFYLPSDSGEKVTLSISILISLHVFFLLVVEIIPPTSLVVPLLGKYLIFAMILVSISICVTVVVLNVHFRSPQTHRMAPWVKSVFVNLLPQFLFIKRPKYNIETSGSGTFSGSCQIHGCIPPLSQQATENLVSPTLYMESPSELKGQTARNECLLHTNSQLKVHRSCFCVRFIAEHTKLLEDSTKVKEDWKYVAMVLDRLFLWIFTLAVLAGTAGIILQAPTLYDDRIPIIENKKIDFSGISAGRCRPSQ